MNFWFCNVKVSVHKSWDSFFKDPIIQNQLTSIQNRIGTNCKPPVRDIFTIFKKDLNNIKCVFIGQDPYPEKNHATGRAFEVNGYFDWEKPNPDRNNSLINILKLLYKNSQGHISSTPIDQIRQAIHNNSFSILPPHKLFKHWEDAGVFLLNTSLSCQSGSPNSHIMLWQCFIRILIEHIDNHRPNCYWFLCGNKAKSYQIFLDNNS